jgi:hypothetical protein
MVFVRALGATRDKSLDEANRAGIVSWKNSFNIEIAKARR